MTGDPAGGRGTSGRGPSRVRATLAAVAVAASVVDGPVGPAAGQDAVAEAMGRAAERREASDRGRAGWVRINGRWVRPAATVGWRDLLSVGVARGGATSVSAEFSAAIEALLANGRAALVEVGGRAYLADVAGRGWDAARNGPTQVLSVRRAPDGADDLACGRGGEAAVAVRSVLVRPGATTVEAVVRPADAGGTVRSDGRRPG